MRPPSHYTPSPWPAGADSRWSSLIENSNSHTAPSSYWKCCARSPNKTLPMASISLAGRWPIANWPHRNSPIYQAAMGVGFTYINRYVVQLPTSGQTIYLGKGSNAEVGRRIACGRAMAWTWPDAGWPSQPADFSIQARCRFRNYHRPRPSSTCSRQSKSENIRISLVKV